MQITSYAHGSLIDTPPCPCWLNKRDDTLLSASFNCYANAAAMATIAGVFAYSEVSERDPSDAVQRSKYYITSVRG